MPGGVIVVTALDGPWIFKNPQEKKNLHIALPGVVVTIFCITFYLLFHKRVAGSANFPKSGLLLYPYQKAEDKQLLHMLTLLFLETAWAHYKAGP